jgi:ribonuclease HI
MSKSFDVNAILSRHRIINGRKISMANVIPHDHVVEFDGGTSSNKPPFGVGYGSYQIDDNEIIRCSYGPNQSSNSAEIMTIVYALDDLVSKEISGKILVCGDSVISLKWINTKETPKENTSESFRKAIKLLREYIPKFKKITPYWRPRERSVELFGH